MDSLLNSYDQAHYFIEGFDDPIQIGQEHLGVTDLLRQQNVSSWSFISAWNPISVELTPDENALRNARLRFDVSRYFVIHGEGRDPKGEWQPEHSFLILGITRTEAIRLARRFGQRAIVYGEKGIPAELVQTLFTVGNADLIRENKTVFLCSRKVTASIILKCYDWAIEQREADNCVISGFHSTIEKDVLHYLLKGTQPIIIALHRGIGPEIEKHFADHTESGRILIISPFERKVTRGDKRTAAIRNRLMIDLADEVIVGHASPGGELEKLLKTIDKRIRFL